MSTEDNKALADRFHRDIFVKGDLAIADEILTPDFVIHSPGLPLEMSHGPEGVKQFATMIRTAFSVSGQQLTHDDTIAEGDKVVIRWTTRTFHHGELMGVPSTGKQVTFTGIDIFRISNGKLVELWQNWDQLGTLQQIGALPVPPPASQ